MLKRKHTKKAANSSPHRSISHQVVQLNSSDLRLNNLSNIAKFTSLGVVFISAFSNTLKTGLETFSYTTQKRFRTQSRTFLTYLTKLKAEGSHANFFNRLATNHQEISRAEWELVQTDYWTHLDNRKEIANRSKAGYINTTRIILQWLSRDGVIPHLSWLPSFDRNAKNADSLASQHISTPQQIALAYSMKGQPCTPMEAKSLMQAYCDLVKDETDPKKFDEIVQDSAYVISKRLVEMRKAGEDVYIAEAEKLRFGRELMARSRINFKKIDRSVEAGHIDWSEHFETSEVGFGKFLLYIKQKWGCVPPLQTGTTRKFAWFSRLAFGLNIADLDSYLAPSIRMQAAAAILILIDTAANPAPIFELRREGVLENDKGHPDHRWLCWEKRRAGGRELKKLLPLRDDDQRVTSVEAVSEIKDANDFLANMAGPSNSGYLFISTRRQGSHSLFIDSGSAWPIRNISAHTMVKEIKDIFAKCPPIREAHLTPRNIRTYVLLKIGLETGDIFAVQKEAQHASIDTSWGYVHRLPMAIKHDALIRKFLLTLEVVVSTKNKTAVQEPKSDIRQINLLSTVFRTGTGLSCSDPHSGIQDGTIEGQACHRIDACLSCANAKTSIEGDVQTLTDILLWKQHLDKEAVRMQRDNLARWIDVWQPWQIFCEVVIEKAEALIPLRRVVATAKAAAISRSVLYPPLW